MYEDRILEEQFVKAMKHIYEMSEEEREELGQLGRDHVMKNFNFETFKKEWDKILQSVYDKYGSWDSRKNYQSWELKEV